MDELLDERVKQLKDIDERIRGILATPNGLWDWDTVKISLNNLRLDLGLWIKRAEEEYAAF